MRRVAILLVALLSASYVQSPALAALNCTISQTNIAFGNVDILSGSAVDVTGTITITCSGVAPPSSALRFCTNIEAGPDVSGSQRRMASGVNRLLFDLYTDAARTVPWGSWATGFKTAGSQNDFNGVGGTINQTITVYARLLSNQQTAATGSYTETFSGGNSTSMRYDRNPSSGNCPIGNSTALAPSWNVTATILQNCRVSATNLNFGTVAVLNSNVDASSTLTVSCTNGTPYNVGLSAGTGAGATVSSRKMTSAGGATIAYSLYANGSRTTVWGNTVAADTVSGTGSGLAQNYTVFGRVPAQTTPAPATYSDSIVATVTY